MQYKGIIVEESLEKPEILSECNITATETAGESGWRLHTVLLDDNSFPGLQQSLKQGPWYAHFWHGPNIVAIFREKIFRFDTVDKATWIPVLKYGRFLGIPEKQLDFPTQDERTVYVFIDASNLWAAQKIKARFLDYAKLVNYLRNKFSASSIKVFYYSAYPAEGTRSYSLDPKHKFFVFLEKRLGFEVRKKALKRISITDEHGESVQEKGNMDVEMTIDAVRHRDKYHSAIFFTGDSDFLALITYLRNSGKKAFVFSSRNNISKELGSGSDGYVDILDIKEDIWGKPLNYRAQKDKKN